MGEGTVEGEGVDDSEGEWVRVRVRGDDAGKGLVVAIGAHLLCCVLGRITRGEEGSCQMRWLHAAVQVEAAGFELVTTGGH